MEISIFNSILNALEKLIMNQLTLIKIPL